MKQGIAIVTGASRGIGKEILTSLVQSGHKVIGTATTTNGAAAISEMIGREKLIKKCFFNL